MKILVTGSSGHLGEALMRHMATTEYQSVGVDKSPGPFTRHVGTIEDRQFVQSCMDGMDAVIHTATLHKPHVATHDRQAFVDTNITGTLNLLEEAAARGVDRFVFTSTTSAFGEALVPAKGAPAAWINESVSPVPKNIYGLTKIAAEDLCFLFHRKYQINCVILRTSRFFPEEDDSRQIRQSFSDVNAKTNEFLFRRVDIEDAVEAHLLAVGCAPDIGFSKYVISATSPFTRNDLEDLRIDAAAVLRRRVPEFEPEYHRRGWRMFAGVDRVYVNEKARTELGWKPKYDFGHVIGQLISGEEPGSALAQLIGTKGYHDQIFDEGPYPTE